MPMFDDILDQVRALLQSRGRLSYRALKRRFDLDDEYLEDLKEELIKAERVAVDEEGAVLVWVGDDTPLPSAAPPSRPAVPREETPAPVRSVPDADRRQLTVMFCDLVGSTPMSAQLDPEDYRDIMQAYQEMCGHVLARFTGHIARYEGDGILVYFGYPQAQEDAAVQAVRASLHILAGLPDLNARFQPRFPLLQERPLQVRIGLHTGLVVVGEMGSEQYRIDIAVGETPNMAARIQGQAGPNEIMISAATYKLVEGLFACEDLGEHELKGIAAPQSVYRIEGESEAHSRFEVAVQKGLTPLVGREEEVRLLYRRWERAQAGAGQVVQLSGEPGIGKSRLVQELKERTAAASPLSVEYRCSPITQNSALAPIIEQVQRLLCFARHDPPDVKLHKLEQALTRQNFSLPDTVLLLAALLSLPTPDRYPPLQFSPQKQKEKTLALLLTWLRKDTEQKPVLIVCEDLHWADPSTVEFLTLLVEQIPTMHALLVLTFRPEFAPPWPVRDSTLFLSLTRLMPQQIVEMAGHVAGKGLPAAVVRQIVSKTDGVPLFVEELTKTVVESGHLQATESAYELLTPLQQIAIPNTLQDSLRARLDRLNAAQELAQLGATIGREFSYELLQAVSSIEEAVLRQGLRQLIEADLVLPTGLPPHAHYLFKHALIRDTAYHSVLKRTRQRYHQRIAQVLEERFAETVATQPELIAHHYTEAGLREEAIPYWHQAGQRAAQRSANVEAENHLTTGIRLLQTLPDMPKRAEHELSFQLALGGVLVTTKSIGALEVERTYLRARTLCEQIGEMTQLVPVLLGLQRCYQHQQDLPKMRALDEPLERLTETVQDPALLVQTYMMRGGVSFWHGEIPRAHEDFARAVAHYDPGQHRAQASFTGNDSGVACSVYLAFTLWHLGYPDQALQTSQQSLALARGVAHPLSVTYALTSSAWLYQLRREVAHTYGQAEAAMRLATDQEFPHWIALSQLFFGWALAVQGQGEAGLTHLRQGLAFYQEQGVELGRTRYLGLLAEVYRSNGQLDVALEVLTEALRAVETREERPYEAELYRLKGELMLQIGGNSSEGSSTAEALLRHALDIARQQQAKSWELRAATSLARLRQQQGKSADARELLAPVYHWFTEGFDTKDLRDAKALLEKLA